MLYVGRYPPMIPLWGDEGDNFLDYPNPQESIHKMILKLNARLFSLFDSHSLEQIEWWDILVDKMRLKVNNNYICVFYHIQYFIV